MSIESPRVAVVGARGIGRHHANWWRVAGAEVCAVLGRSEDSARETAEKLRDAFGITPLPYADFGRMIEMERPHIADICSPPETHGHYIRAALEAGCNILCEKPLLFNETRSAAEMLQEARELVGEVARKELRLALCSQYAVAASEIMKIHRERSGAERPVYLEGSLCSPARGRAPNPPRTWIDLGPHLLAAVQVVAAGGKADWNSAHIETSGHRAEISFRWITEGGSELECRLRVNHREVEPAHERRLVFDGCTYDLSGERGPDGLFQVRYSWADGSVARPDPMRILIADFLAGRDWLDSAASLENQQLLLDIWSLLCREGRS